jgi:exonuclease SbcC
MYVKLRDALEELLAERRPLIEPAPRESDPLFLLCTVKPDVIGFAVLKGQPKESFLKGVQEFKDLYSIRLTQWADFDLNLVFCRSDTPEATDEYCNSIEMDPYFCRKFVIDLDKDLKTELAHLPFIPIVPETTFGYKRPVSAQTFLMKHGITSTLARYLAVPHARGIDRIIEESLEGFLGKPMWLKQAVDEGITLIQPEPRPNIRLKGLEISNFRAYHGIHRFDLDADLVVLFGPNGFGKTSFFDAIDFACTGGVARFDDRIGRKTDRLINALKHLDFPIEDSFVKIEMLIDNKPVSFERYMKDRTQAYLDGLTRDRGETLMVLTGLLEEPPDLRIENLVRLFRATHLFGQEFQSLTSRFEVDSDLPEDVVSRMLALQDYVESINKAKNISEELKKRISEINSEIVSLKASLKIKKSEIDEFERSARNLEEPEAILAKGKSIGEKVLQEISIPFQISTEVNPETIRSWRGFIEAEIKVTTQNLELISQLEGKLPNIPSYRKKIEESSSELKQSKELLAQAERDYSEKKKKLDQSGEKNNKILREEKDLSLKRENLKWLGKTKFEYEQLKDRSEKNNKVYQNIQAQLLDVMPKIRKMELENKGVEETLGKLMLDIETLERDLKRIQDFKGCVNDWVTTISRHKELEVNIHNIEQEIGIVKNQLIGKRGELNTATITQIELEKLVENLQQSQSELKSLLDKIEMHIIDNICPVCGTPHKSRGELIEKLKCLRGGQPEKIRNALKSFEDSKAKVQAVRKQVSNLELKLNALEVESKEAQNSLLVAREKLKNYEDTAVSLNFSKMPENLAAVLVSREKGIIDQINLKQQERSIRMAEFDKQKEELNSYYNNKGVFEQKALAIESETLQLQSMLQKISRNALARQVSLEMGTEAINRDLAITDRAMESLHKQVEASQKEYQNLQKETNSLIEKIDNLKERIKGLDKERLESKKYIEEVETLIKRFNLDINVEMSQIAFPKRDFVEKLSRLRALRTEVTNFEIVIDSLQISAALAKARHEMEDLEKRIQKQENGLIEIKRWFSHFNNIFKELELLRSKAIKEYTDKFGPLTSTIQRRLRSIYGFGEMELFSEKGRITVRVKRKGDKSIRPSDFFSQSQIQILMLSLFLSAGLTQTWSNFGSILLDDPVTHFDDLNAYSLIDLIKGLIMESGKRNQFIISTCENRLFRLMRQKFSKIDVKVNTYVFESIGEKGPKIKELRISS